MAGNPLMAMMGGNNGPMAAIMNSPIMQLVGALKNGGNPQAMLQLMMGQNPQMRQAMDSMQGKSPQEMSDYLKTAAQQKGIDLGQIATQIGMPTDIAEQFGIKM